MNLDSKRKYFNELAPRWDHIPKPPDTPEKLARFVARSLTASCERVLDVGCGTGVLLGHIGEAAAPREVVELDLAEDMLRENRAKSGGAAADYVCAAAQQPPFRDNSFDRILCFNALPHLAPIEGTLRQFLGCLRAGGLLAIGHVMESSELNSFHAALGGAVGSDRLPPAPELVRLLEDLGMEIACQEEEPGWYLVQARKRA